MNLFDDDIQGGSRKGIAFVRRMMGKTKAKHNGYYRKPPAVPFRYKARQPKDWSEHIQRHFGADGAEIVKYDRPAKRTKTDEEKEYDLVHKWAYWGLRENQLEYDESTKRWWIGDTGYAFPPVLWKAPNGESYWGLPHYESREKGKHFDRIAFKADKYPETRGQFSKRYATEKKEGELYHTHDNIFFNGTELEVLDGVVSHSRSFLSREPRYYAWYRVVGEQQKAHKDTDGYAWKVPVFEYTVPEPDKKWSEGREAVERRRKFEAERLREQAMNKYKKAHPTTSKGELERLYPLRDFEAKVKNTGQFKRLEEPGRVRAYRDYTFAFTGEPSLELVEPTETPSTPDETKEAIKNIRSAIKELKNRGTYFAELNKKATGQEDRFNDAITAWEQRKKANDERERPKSKVPVPILAGVGGHSIDEIEGGANYWNSMATMSSDYIRFLLEVIEANNDLLEELGEEPEDATIVNKAGEEQG